MRDSLTLPRLDVFPNGVGDLTIRLNVVASYKITSFTTFTPHSSHG
jgi:hypothetical protein